MFLPIAVEQFCLLSYWLTSIFGHFPVAFLHPLTQNVLGQGQILPTAFTSNCRWTYCVLKFDKIPCSCRNVLQIFFILNTQHQKWCFDVHFNNIKSKVQLQHENPPNILWSAIWHGAKQDSISFWFCAIQNKGVADPQLLSSSFLLDLWCCPILGKFPKP